MYLLCCGRVTSVSLLSSSTTTGIKWERVCHTSFTRLWGWIWWNHCLGWRTLLLYKWPGNRQWVAMASTWQCKGGSCNPWVRRRDGQGFWTWLGRTIKTLQAATAPQHNAWIFSCGNKLQLPKVWFKTSTEMPRAPAVCFRKFTLMF